MPLIERTNAVPERFQVGEKAFHLPHQGLALSVWHSVPEAQGVGGERFGRWIVAHVTRARKDRTRRARMRILFTLPPWRKLFGDTELPLIRHRLFFVFVDVFGRQRLF